VSASSYDTHWFEFQVTIFTAAVLSRVTVAPAAMTSSISEKDNVPADAVHGPGLPPALKGQPAEVHEGSESVKLRP
jgi:hypothetical protein